MYTDFYLKFEDEAEFKSVMTEEIFSDEDLHIDVIGKIYREPEVDSNGDLVGEIVANPGYHVNIRTAKETLPESLQEFAISAPVTPKRVWA